MSIDTTLVCTMTKQTFSAERISRNGDRSLGSFQLTPETATALAQDRIGLLAAGFLRLDSMVERFVPFIKSEGPQNVFIYPSKSYGTTFYRILSNHGLLACKKVTPDIWRIGSSTFASVEKLRSLRYGANELDTVVLLDPTCMVHKARNLNTFGAVSHDRPQRIVNFLDDHSVQERRPTFVLATTQRSMTLPTDHIARIYCLNAWWFLDGNTLT